MDVASRMYVHEQRPRERLAALGAHALSDTELLALLLGAGRRGQSVTDVAAQLLGQSNGLPGLARRSTRALVQLDGLGPAKAARLCAAFELGVRALRPADLGAPLLDSRAVFVRYGRALAHAPTERFWVISLDAKNRPKAATEVARGGRTNCQVDAAEVFRCLVADSAAHAVVLHNHPSGDPAPSADDLSLTERLCRAGELLEIRILDHLIVGHGRYTSLRDEGLWPSP
ncbi:MAG: DNA repair protein RadC [Myxococcota bacterium]